MHLTRLALYGVAILLSISAVSADVDNAVAQSNVNHTSHLVKRANPPCARICRRQEIRSLSVSQRNAFFQAFRQLNSGPKPTKYDQFVKIHLDYANQIHSNDFFLVWHRLYTRRLEMMLQQVNPSICLPYWRWDLDSQAPEASPVMGPAFMGGNGRGSGMCVSDGAFANFQVMYPRRGCLQRNYRQNGRIGALPSVNLVNQVLNSNPTYIRVRSGIEYSLHPYLHNQVGGAMSTMASPADPLFFLHHAFVDQMYWQWQRGSPNRLNDFNGAADINRRPINLNSILPGLGQPVRDAMSAEALCYTYASSSGSSSSSGSRLFARSYSEEAPAAESPAAESPAADVTSVPATPAPIAPITSNVPLTNLAYLKDASNLPANVTYLPGPKTAAKSKGVISTSAISLNLGSNSNEEQGAGPGDRSYFNTLRPLPPITRDFIEMNGWNESDIRAREAACNKIHEDINNIPGYMSPSSLWNQPILTTELVSSVQNFTIYIAGSGAVVIHFDHSKSAAQIIADVKATAINIIEALIQPAVNFEKSLANAMGSEDYYDIAPVTPSSPFKFINKASTCRSKPHYQPSSSYATAPTESVSEAAGYPTATPAY